MLSCPAGHTATSSTLKNQKLELSLSLLKENIEKANDNFIVSPFSIYMMTDMLANGAKGKTLLGLQKKILDKTDQLSIEDITSALANEMKNQSSAIEINNSIWGNKFKDEYKEIINTLYTEIFDLPLTTDTINTWIENKTHGMIAQVLTPKPTFPDELYLVNTVYFKDKWQQSFTKEDTKKKRFHSLNKSMLPDFVNMMYQENGDIPYYENDKLQAIRLSYKKRDYIDIILPKEHIDFKKFIKDLNVSDLNFSYIPSEVHISLPRLETEYRFDLKDFIKNLNIPMFKEDTGFDFSAMCSKDCHVTKIIHQAKIQLDEEGTTAAAVTTTVMYDSFGEESFPILPKIFNANRPFIYIINDGLFIGAYTQGKLFE